MTPRDPNVDYVEEAIEQFADANRDAMLERLHDGARRGWGTSWRSANYTDTEVKDRLARAVTHLEAALDGYRLYGHVGPDELRKRAADVANQAFMLADPARLGEP
jgi:hypothetical protein